MGTLYCPPRQKEPNDLTVEGKLQENVRFKTDGCHPDHHYIDLECMHGACQLVPFVLLRDGRYPHCRGVTNEVNKYSTEKYTFWNGKKGKEANYHELKIYLKT